MNRKRLLIVLLMCILVSLLVIYIKQYNVKENENNEILINDLGYGSTYMETVKILGEPQNKVNLQDETLNMLYGYYVIWEYDGIQLTFNADEDFKMITDGDISSIFELDVISPKYNTSKGITIGSNKKELKEAYGIDNKLIYYKKTDEIPIDNHRIRGFRRELLPFIEYDEYCYITSEEPIGLIFLLKDDKVVRIIIRHLTAG